MHLETELCGLYSSHVTTRSCGEADGYSDSGSLCEHGRTSTDDNSIILT
jgi:hypothetical protein